MPATPIGIYIHVPFCSSRCSYCDFVTYVPGELDDRRSPDHFAASAVRELDLLARSHGGRPVDTVYFGGGTPTLLPAADLLQIVEAIDDRFGIAGHAEISTEANPDSVTVASLARLRGGGFTRVSFGMQSVEPHVLATLGRTHAPARPLTAVAEARAAGFAHVSLDLIYGTPGETDDDWAASLAAVLHSGVDHISAYGLIVEPRTPLARDIRLGAIAAPDDDVLAARYRMADRLLVDAGFEWYEVSNWARSPSARCRHNQRYWRNGDWLGVGPGAHSHIAGHRWWNVAQPAQWTRELNAGRLGLAGEEHLDPAAQALERLMLGVRTADGLLCARSTVTEQLEAEGLAAHDGERLRLTLEGRLLADLVVRRLASR